MIYNLGARLRVQSALDTCVKVPSYVKEYNLETFPFDICFNEIQFLVSQTIDNLNLIFGDQQIYIEISVVWNEL